MADGIKLYDMQTITDSKVKLRTTLSLPSGVILADTEFELHFYVRPNSRQVFRKEDLVKVDGNSYDAIVDTAIIGPGEIMVEARVELPEAGGTRTEIVAISTGIITYPYGVRRS